MLKQVYTISIFAFAFVCSLQAQDFPSGNSGAPSQALQQQAEADTFDFTYFFPHNPGLEFYFSDTLLGKDFQQYDPVRQRELDYAHLGNLGSAHHQLVYEPLFRKGLDIGFHQYDLYKIKAADLRFYKLRNAFTDVSFSQGPTQQDTYFKGRFSRDFSNNLNFSIDYKRINNKGLFKHQESVNTALATGFWYHHPGGNYDAFMTYVSNTIIQEDNGGIRDSLLTDDNTVREFNFPVSINGTAETYHVERAFSFLHHYNLLGKIDSVKTQSTKRPLVITHELEYAARKYKFYDSKPAADSSYYGMLQVDNRGLRHFLGHNNLENSFWISTSKKGDSEKTNQRDFFKAGITHTLNWIDQEASDSVINNLFLNGEWNFSPNERLQIKTYGHFGIWDNAGDYRLTGDLFFDFKKAGNFNVKAIAQSYSPALTQHRLYISEQLLWKNNFDRTLETSLAATYSLPLIGFKVSGQYHLINNLIYYDTLAMVKQTGVPVSILQFILNQDIKLGNFHLDNTVVLQTITENILRLPEFYSKHSLFVEGKIFRDVMLARIGFDLRMTSNYFADYYQPLIGQFHLQNRKEIELYPALDAFLSFRVKTFRFFLKAENLTSLITNEVYYQEAFYPQPYMVLRFGVTWRMLN